jgi:hypothetical protein
VLLKQWRSIRMLSPWVTAMAGIFLSVTAGVTVPATSYPARPGMTCAALNATAEVWVTRLATVTPAIFLTPTPWQGTPYLGPLNTRTVPSLLLLTPDGRASMQAWRGRITPLPTNMTAEEIEWRVRLDLAAHGGKSYDFPTETCGKPIEIAGRTIALPADTYVSGVMTDVDCVAGSPCDVEIPAYGIVHGYSSISVGLATGRINGESVAHGEEHYFDFLKSALQ